MNMDQLNQRTSEILETVDYQTADVIERLTYKLFEIMESQNVNKSQLAKRINRSRAWVGKVLSGDHNMTIKTAVTLFKELGYELDFVAKSNNTHSTEFNIPLLKLVHHDYTEGSRYQNAA